MRLSVEISKTEEGAPQSCQRSKGEEQEIIQGYYKADTSKKKNPVSQLDIHEKKKIAIAVH